MIYKSMKLGEMLLAEGVLSDEQLNTALDKQKNSNRKLGEILITEGYVTEKELLEFLSRQLSIPYLNLNTVEIDNSLAELLPETIARVHVVVPLEKADSTLTVAVSDPLDFVTIRNIESLTKCNINVVIAEKTKIENRIDKLYSYHKASTAAQELSRFSIAHEEEKTAAEQDSDEPIVRFINNMFENAILNNASDIHIEPLADSLRIRFRIDGHLSLYMETNADITPSVVSRLKIIGNMNIAEKRLPQDGRISYTVNNRTVDLRISVLPCVFGEKIVIRVTNNQSFNYKKENLGFSKENLDKFDKLIKNPHGIILVTGATGSGKTTTLYTALNEIKRDDINIVTIENPVEMLIEGITQVEINPKAGLTFAAALRSILRQDPDVIMVGEIRDEETAKIAVSAAITGHLVFSTLHTYDAPSTIVRLIDMGIAPYMVSSAVSGIVSQKLLRTICTQCKSAYTATPAELDVLGFETDRQVTLYKGLGCPRCNYTGNRGRTAICEVMQMTPALRDAVHFLDNLEGIEKAAIDDGMVTLSQNAMEKVLSGEISFNEMMTVLASPI
ncbi:MAG: Flp pilus assembly complex ATPase component TadA [Clostridiales bacterium]|nr:Flp pilus assembly complex ATPase component TadA [Clostridiales bacterium]